jgi:hypothetical protein
VWTLRAWDSEPRQVRCAAALDGTDWYLTPVQADNAALLVGTSLQRGLPARAATIALATALQESRLENIDYGDRDSLGLFQQRPSQGWGTPEQIMDPVYSTGAFYDGLVEVDGYADLEVTVAAQAVQRSGFPDAYAQHEARARAWASAMTGHSPGAVTCSLPELAEDPATDGGVDALTDRLARDLGLPGTAVSARDADGSDGTEGADEERLLDLDASALGSDTGDATWAVAHWAVATASVTGVVDVRADDLVWTRADGTWSTVDEGDAQPAGRVVVALPQD